MRLSDLQSKEIVNMTDGKKVGKIIDVVIDPNQGFIKGLTLEQRNNRFLLNSREEYEIDWRQIVKIGEDIILIDTKMKN